AGITGGGVIGGPIGLGVSQEEASYYHSEGEAGGGLGAVKAGARPAAAAALPGRRGAYGRAPATTRVRIHPPREGGRRRGSGTVSPSRPPPEGGRRRCDRVSPRGVTPQGTPPREPGCAVPCA